MQREGMRGAEQSCMYEEQLSYVPGGCSISEEEGKIHVYHNSVTV